MSMTSSSHSVTLQPGEGHSVGFMGDTFTFKVKGEDTGGAYAVFEVTAPENSAPPMHRHDHTDESCYVLEGTMKLEIDGKEMMLGPGGFAMIPKGTMHRHSNGGKGQARVLVTISPAASMEGFYEEMAKLAASMPPGPPSADGLHEMNELGERYGTFAQPPQ